ncbi:MAG: hypothetical protein L7F78_15140, partial [Syntrophales bacterium LBB04]|nr:hypothetical protein [Syntrophales bacterium LBB04]
AGGAHPRAPGVETQETAAGPASEYRLFQNYPNPYTSETLLEFVLPKYIETGVEELDQEKLPDLLMLKYQTISDAAEMLGGVENIKATFIDFQKHLYEQRVAL